MCSWTHRGSQLVYTISDTALNLLQKPTDFATGSVLDEGCVNVSVWSEVIPISYVPSPHEPLLRRVCGFLWSNPCLSSLRMAVEAE
jgi:hypothetical protein